ncbi:MAG: MerR family transcriptional regulator [Candidatus Omnitrophica bacterium]|nr:MerR family transcriptional regulator [Candidatus Omnitrophota bacterium]
MRGIIIHNIYLIKDLARITGYSIHTIKYYLKIGLIKETSRSPETNFRYFDDATVDSLKRIREFRRQGKSIKTIGNELL